MGMNIVHSGNQFQIYSNALKTYERLPAGTYEVGFSKFSGFFLTAHNDLVVNEAKVYGCSEQKVKKVLNSFSKVDRNFGVILSGRKGIGKSLFARLLAVHSKEVGLPLILVSAYYPGIASFLTSIEQEVVVLFDEFEKTFAGNEDVSPQEELLPMFDGLDGGKKLFVVTCNEVNKLNTYLLNRPGRFHYHFILTNPTPDEIREYLTDKLEEQHHHVIKKVVNFSAYTDLTYDILRAIAFEINNGYSFEEALGDLNISRETTPRYDVIVEFSDGTTSVAANERIDLYSSDRDFIWFVVNNGNCRGSVRMLFRPCDASFDIGSAEITIDPQMVEVDVDADNFNMDDADSKALYEHMRNVSVSKVTFVRRVVSSSTKYLV